MSTPTERVVDQAIAKMDADDAGQELNNDKEIIDDGKKAEDAAGGKPEPGKDNKPAGDKGDDPDAGKKPDDDEGTFTAEDALEVEEPEVPGGAPAAPANNAGIQLSEPEQKYLLENIGQPIILNGFKLKEDGTQEAYQIKALSWEGVPKDFNFATQADAGQAGAAFQRLDDKAKELLGNFRSQQSQTAAQEFEQRENAGIQADVADLQKAGRFPKFKVQPGAAGFDDSAEAKQMAEVLEVMASTNENYMKQYQQGRPYKHIGFAEAYEIYERSNPKKQAEKKADEDQEAEDKERKDKAERGNQNRGTGANNLQKPTVKSGTTTRQLLARIDAEE